MQKLVYDFMMVRRGVLIGHWFSLIIALQGKTALNGLGGVINKTATDERLRRFPVFKFVTLE